MILPITLPQWQAHASNRRWQGYGSKPSSCRAVLRAVQILERECFFYLFSK